MHRRLRQHVERKQENPRRDRLTNPTQRQRAQRDAKLHGGQKIVEVMLELADGTCPGDARFKKLLDARVADGDKRELRGHEEAVRQNEQDDGDAFDRHKPVHLVPEDSIRHGNESAAKVLEPDSYLMRNSCQRTIWGRNHCGICGLTTVTDRSLNPGPSYNISLLRNLHVAAGAAGGIRWLRVKSVVFGSGW